MPLHRSNPNRSRRNFVSGAQQLELIENSKSGDPGGYRRLAFPSGWRKPKTDTIWQQQQHNNTSLGPEQPATSYQLPSGISLSLLATYWRSDVCRESCPTEWPLSSVHWSLATFAGDLHMFYWWISVIHASDLQLATRGGFGDAEIVHTISWGTVGQGIGKSDEKQIALP